LRIATDIAVHASVKAGRTIQPPAASKASGRTRKGHAPAPSMAELDIVNEDFATGKHSRVSLVRSPERALCIWKRAADDSKSHQIAFRKEVERMRILRRLGLSRVESRWHEDGRSLLRTYVPGVLAIDRIQSNDFWTGETYWAERRALAELITCAARQQAYVNDLHPSNLIFDGFRWQIIDSGSIRFVETPQAALKKYRQRLMKNWSSYLHPSLHSPLWSFLKELSLERDC